jgi:nucleotide-binding universal stress UspA family protein
MKTILFPTDFSKNASHAASYACMLAKLYNANLVLLHVHNIPMVPQNHSSIEVKSAISEHEKTAKEDLKLFTEKCILESNLNFDRFIQRVEYGFPAEKIVEIAAAIKADMIVMGTQGASNLLDKWIGTIAEDVIKKAQCPVFTIPKNAHIESPNTIIYAADFKENEILATEKLLYLAKPLGITCQVLHIQEDINSTLELITDEKIREFDEIFKNEKLTIKRIHHSNVIEGLKDYIETNKPDVLAMAIHEKSFWYNIFNTSITKYFIQEAELPMLTFKK